MHPKLMKQLERRLETLGPEGGIDWAQAEALALASLVTEGVPVRLTGQDTERGTFAHRHLVLHDVETGETYAPIEHLAGATGALRGPQLAALRAGLRSASSTATRSHGPEALVLWEAQFGDFVNGAQVIVDQFIVSGLSKWGKTSRLSLLLPHGYEGNGPEHSSARRRALHADGGAGEHPDRQPDDGRAVLPPPPPPGAHPKPRPLVVLTPKSLLRLKQATSHVEDLTAGRFRPVLDDPALDDDARAQAERLILCTGKVYYDIVGHEAGATRARTSRSPGWSSSTRSRSRRTTSSSRATPS